MTVIAKYLSELILAELEKRTPNSIPDGISLDDLIQIAMKNHMLYIIVGGLLKTNISEVDKQRLRPYVIHSIMRTATQIQELNTLEKRFEEEGIANQPMKGSRMKFMYPKVEMREMSDIDILVQEDCMQKASAILIELGYRLDQSINHHDIYSKEPYIIVEAHRAMYDKTVDKYQYEYFKDFSKRVLKKGCSYTYDFSKEDFYLYMMSHMAKHFYKRGCGIRNIMDVYVYQKLYVESMDQEYLSHEFEKCGLCDFVNHIETLAKIWLGGMESTEFYDNLFLYMLDSGIYGKDENGIWNQFSKEKNQTKHVNRFKLKRWYAFPPVCYMSEDYPWVSKYPFLLPCAWFVRGVNGFIRSKGTYKRKMLHEIDDNKINNMRQIYQAMNLNFSK